jgi:hypothetical protein
MEMRRRARPSGSSNGSRGRAERGLLTARWLVSGSGLRAWRALAWLGLITALLGVAFPLVGFAKPPQPVTYWTSLLYAFRATLSLADSNVQLLHVLQQIDDWVAATRGDRAVSQSGGCRVTAGRRKQALEVWATGGCAVASRTAPS